MSVAYGGLETATYLSVGDTYNAGRTAWTTAGSLAFGYGGAAAGAFVSGPGVVVTGAAGSMFGGWLAGEAYEWIYGKLIVKPVRIQVGVPYYAAIVVCIVPIGTAAIGNALYYLSHGYFKTGTVSFLGLLVGVALLLFVALRVAPAYLAVLSDEGINVSHRVTVFGVTLFDLSCSAPWEDVRLDWYTLGWIWGLVLVFPLKGSRSRWPKMVWLNRTFTSKKEALQFVVAKLPAWRISDEARKRLSRMGILAA